MTQDEKRQLVRQLGSKDPEERAQAETIFREHIRKPIEDMVDQFMAQPSIQPKFQL